MLLCVKMSALKLCMNLAFAGSLRIGELLGLTWECVDISEEAIKENRAYLYVNKEVQRVKKSVRGIRPERCDRHISRGAENE